MTSKIYALVLLILISIFWLITPKECTNKEFWT